jgi:hypothetical protein
MLAIIKMLRVRIKHKKFSLFAKQDFVVNLCSKLSDWFGRTTIMASSLDSDSLLIENEVKHNTTTKLKLIVTKGSKKLSYIVNSCCCIKDSWDRLGCFDY